MKVMTARYPGKCSRTGARINPGDTIVFEGKGRAYLSDLIPAVNPDVSYARSLDPDLDEESAAAAGRYLRQSMERGVSHIWNSGGREYYRNRQGRCEDAPCCGCCNV